MTAAVGASGIALEWDDALSTTFLFRFPEQEREAESFLGHGWRERRSHHFQSEVVDMSAAKPRRYLDIPTVGGYTDETWEVDMGNEIWLIRKPKDPLADLEALGKGMRCRTLEEAKEAIDKAILEEVTREREGR